jgi:hypothetical protein
LALRRSHTSQVPVFRHLSAKGALTLINYLQPMIVMPNDLVIKEGDVGDRMFFFDSGESALFRRGWGCCGAASTGAPKL